MALRSMLDMDSWFSSAPDVLPRMIGNKLRQTKTTTDLVSGQEHTLTFSGDSSPFTGRFHRYYPHTTTTTTSFSALPCCPGTGPADPDPPGETSGMTVTDEGAASKDKAEVHEGIFVGIASLIVGFISSKKVKGARKRYNEQKEAEKELKKQKEDLEADSGGDSSVVDSADSASDEGKVTQQDSKAAQPDVVEEVAAGGEGGAGAGDAGTPGSPESGGEGGENKKGKGKKKGKPKSKSPPSGGKTKGKGKKKK